MGLLAKVFGAVSREEMRGIRLDVTRPFWELSGKTDFPLLLVALPSLLSEECILYFEGGSPRGELQEFLQAQAVPERPMLPTGRFGPSCEIFTFRHPGDNEPVGRPGMFVCVSRRGQNSLFSLSHLPSCLPESASVNTLPHARGAEEQRGAFRP